MRRVDFLLELRPLDQLKCLGVKFDALDRVHGLDLT